MECLRAALRFGADAVYVGGPQLQLRAANAGFSMDALAQAVKETHALGRRLYVTVNAFPTNDELEALGDYAQGLFALGVDAAIVADLGAVAVMRKAAPNLPIHISTQANCLNWAAATAWYELGATRVVLAREMTLEQIGQLRAHTPAALELEAFVHGAMCMAWSGRCMISAYRTGRSANRGGCTQSSRWRYHLVEEKRPGEFFPVEEDDRGTTILSSQDLNCLDFLEQIAAAGVTSFKIEGRMKSPYYVATVTNAYRQRLDGLANGPASSEFLALLQRELDAVSHRTYASGFYFGQMRRHAPDDGVYRQDCVFAGVVMERLDSGRVRIQLRNPIHRSDVLEVLSPGSLGRTLLAEGLTTPDGRALAQVVEPMVLFDMDAPPELAAGDMLRKRL